MRSSRHVASIVELLIKPAIPLVYLFLIDLFINFRVHVFQFVFPNQLIHSVKAKNIFYFWKNVGDGVTVRPTSSHDRVRRLKIEKQRKEKKLLQVDDGKRGFEGSIDRRRFISSTSWFECPLSCPVSARISMLRQIYGHT